MKNLICRVALIFYPLSLMATETERYFSIHEENECSLEDVSTLGFWWPWSKEEITDVVTNKDPFIVSNILEMKEILYKKVLGQHYAIDITVDYLISYAAGIHDPTRPIGSLLYIGPTGVGKTELAKELTRQIFKNENKLVRLNMSEFTTEHTLWRLIGPAVGYKESEKGGILSNAILKDPYSIILIDEFEKAHPKIQKLFLHIFDEGEFTTGLNQAVNCRHCLFIVTTNVGASSILDLSKKGVSNDDILEEIEPLLIQELSPEVYNRVEPVIFNGLTKECLHGIVVMKLQELAKRIWNTKKIQVIFEDSVIDYLKEQIKDVQLGARPLQRLIKKKIESAVAKSLIADHYQSKDRMIVRYADECIITKKEAAGL